MIGAPGAKAPGTTLEIWEQANALNLEGRLDEAEALYDALLTQNPENAGLLATMGTLLMKQGKTGLAVALLHRAAQKSPESDILSNLGLAYKYSGQHEKALQCLDRAIKDNPSAETLNTYAGLHINVGTPEIALKHADRSLQAAPEYAMAHWNKAMALLELGRWDTAWDEHEHGFEARMRIRRELGGKYWDGTEGKTVAVYGEQGLGDEIMFASMLPDLMARNNVILECHPRLKTLFEKAFHGLTIYGTRDKPEIEWQHGHEIDYSVSIGSLGKWFRRDRSAFPGTPYLKADPLPRGNKFRVGISWTGGLKPGRVAVRSIPLAWWQPILNVPDVEFVSLQYTDAAADIAATNARGYDIKVMDEYVKADDYYETARLVASCDLVISIATSVYHLAGALGVPAWVMVPNKPAWREHVQGGIPWYRSVRAYRQPKGDAEMWRPVVERVAFDLDELVSAKQRRAA